MSIKLAILLIAVWCAIPYQLVASDKNNKPTNTSNNSSHEKEGIFSHIDETNLISNPGFENWTSSLTLGKYNGAAGLFIADTINVLAGRQSAFIFTENQDRDYSDVQLFSFLEFQKIHFIRFHLKQAYQKPL